MAEFLRFAHRAPPLRHLSPQPTAPGSRAESRTEASKPNGGDGFHEVLFLRDSENYNQDFFLQNVCKRFGWMIQDNYVYINEKLYINTYVETTGKSIKNLYIVIT